MAGAYVQASNGAAAATAGFISTDVFGAGVTAGNAIAWLVVYFDNSGTHLTTLTRSGDSTVIQAGTFGAGTGIGGTYGVIENASAGTSPVVATFGGSGQTFIGIYAAEYSGLASTGTLFQSGEKNTAIQATPGTGADGLSSGTITPAVQPFTLLGWSLNPNSGTNIPAAGTGFTGRTIPNHWTSNLGEALRPEDKFGITSLTPIAATFTAAANTQHISVGMVLRELVIAAAVPPRPRPRRVNFNYYLG